MHCRSPISCGVCTKTCFDWSVQLLPLLKLFLFTSQHSDITVRSLSRSAFSAAVHPKYQKAEEHSDSHKGDGRRGGEELPVVDAEVPHHSQYHHEHRHHQAAGANGNTGSPQSSRDPRPGSCSSPRRSPFLWTGLVQDLRDVAVDHAVVCDV